jgi:H+/Cl- antiporter ClcA
MLAGGMATWVSEREGWGDVERRVAVQSSVGSAWGGLFTTPFVPSLMALELQHRQSPAVWPLLMIQTLSSVAGFSIFYLAGGWAEVIRFLALPEYSFDLVDLAFAGLIGVVGAAGAMLFVILHRRLEALARPLADRPVLRSTIGGALLGLLGVALPLTLFNGAGGLAIVTSDTAELGVTLILVSAIAKIVATTTALAFGFIGGPIFPALFAGGSFGVILHEVVPSMPLAISVSGSMAAMTAALVAVPFSLSVLVMLIAGAPVEAAPPVLTAAVVSFVIVRGLAPTPPAVDPSEPTTAPPPD